MDPVIGQMLERETSRTKAFRDHVTGFNNRCQDYLRGLWGYNTSEEEEEEEEEDGDVEGTFSNLE